MGVSSLAAGIYWATLKINLSTITKLEEKFGREQLEKFLDDFNTAGRIEALTEKEGRTILGQPSLDTIRNRIIAEAQEAGIDLSAWKVRRSPREVTPSSKTGISKPVVKYSKSKAIQAAYVNGQVYLVRDGIEKGQAFPVLLHELGEYTTKQVSIPSDRGISFGDRVVWAVLRFRRVSIPSDRGISFGS